MVRKNKESKGKNVFLGEAAEVYTPYSLKNDFVFHLQSHLSACAM